MIIEFILVGVLGGFVRALYGLMKAIEQGIIVNKLYFAITLIVSASIGGLLGTIFEADYRVACLAGYVGTDILENVFSGVAPKTILLKKK